MPTPGPQCARVAAIAVCAAQAAWAGANDNPHGRAFVSLYRCDAERWVAVAYPAPFARASEPVRLSWNGGTVLLSLARSASGARYASKSADLEWKVKDRGATLSRLSGGAPLVSNCVET